ncbi:MAG TPA: hypothetical protein VJZ71_19050 [Phycisphaerae bacterium]|nr:hypothetical protein [Phycisphaerae bacterium]
MKTKKKFDCVKMKDDAQQRRANELKGLSQTELLEYYRHEHEELAKRQQRLRRNGDSEE